MQEDPAEGESVKEMLEQREQQEPDYGNNGQENNVIITNDKEKVKEKTDFDKDYAALSNTEVFYDL